MTFLLRRRIRIDRHFRINDRWSHDRIWMRHGFRLFDDTGITGARFDLLWRDRRHRRYRTDVCCPGKMQGR